MMHSYFIPVVYYNVSMEDITLHSNDIFVYHDLSNILM